MKQSQFDLKRLDAKLAVLKEKRKWRNEVRKTKIEKSSIGTYSRVTAPSSNLVKNRTAPAAAEEVNEVIKAHLYAPCFPPENTSHRDGLKSRRRTAPKLSSRRGNLSVASIDETSIDVTRLKESIFKRNEFNKSL